MGGRGSSSSKSKGGGGGMVGDGTQPTGRVSGGGNINIEFETEPKQEPTKAKLLENMNEAQVDLEIAQEQKIIESAQKIMDKNSTESAYMRAGSKYKKISQVGDFMAFNGLDLSKFRSDRTKMFDKRTMINIEWGKMKQSEQRTMERAIQGSNYQLIDTGYNMKAIIKKPK